MPTPNLPPGFDFTDPDVYARRLPVEEFGEQRRSGGTSRPPVMAAASTTAATGW